MDRALREDASDAPIYCADVGLEISFPSRDVQAAMEELRDGAEPGSKLQSCMRSSLMQDTTQHMKHSLRNFAVSALDCVPEPLDWESSTIALFTIASVCSRSNVAVEADMDVWNSEMKRELDALFAFSSGHQQRITFGSTTGLVRQVALSKPYELPPDGNGVPVLDIKAIEMWSEGDDSNADMNVEAESASFFTFAKLEVGNAGAIPLHVFRVTVERHGAVVQGGDDASTDFVLSLVTPASFEPGARTAITVKAVTSTQIVPSDQYSLYISHSGFRAHFFDGVVEQSNQFTFQKPALINIDGTDSGNVFTRFSVDATLVGSEFSAFPVALWQVGSMGIAVTVGVFVAMFIRRKFGGLVYFMCAMCPCGHSRRTVKRGNMRSRASKSVSRASTSSTASCSDSVDEEEHEHLIEMRRLDGNAKSSATVNEEAPVKPSRPRLQVKAPEVSLQRKPPLVPATRRLPATPKSKSPKPQPTPKHQPLALDITARLDPQQFESMWDSYAERFQREMPAASAPDASTLVANMKRVGISCMASGTVNNVEKYVFYGKERHSSWFFLVAIDIAIASKVIVITVRTSQDAAEHSVQQMTELTLATLALSNSAA